MFGARTAPMSPPHLPLQTLDFLLAGATVIGALAAAAVALLDMPRWRLLAHTERVATASMIVLRRLHSGCVNDYIAWLVAGVATIGAALALA